MSLDFGSGSLYMIDGDQTTLLGKGCYTEELELSANEILTKTYSLTNSASMECEMSGVNMELLNNLCGMPYDGRFAMEYQIPIMIQARWHKKPRIRKKWLKRYGMKQDTVKMIADANALEYHPGHILEEQCYPNGVCATFDSFGFEVDKQEVIFRPDQMRRGLKIEW